VADTSRFSSQNTIDVILFRVPPCTAAAGDERDGLSEAASFLAFLVLPAVPGKMPCAL